MSSERSAVLERPSTGTLGSATAERVRWPALSRDELTQLASLTLQLAVLVYLLIAFRIENTAFYYRVAPMAAIGFVVHHLLPMRWRLPFFAALSLATIVVVFGFAQAGWLIALGGMLIAITQLPIRFAWRVVLLLGAGAAMAVGRLQLVPVPWESPVWPILGSMFMFRLIAYMYDLRHLKEKPTLARTIAYFFCLPNVSFLLFPVIDYATFRRTYYDRDAFQIYRQGVHWMVRGVTHLMLYRMVYQHATILPTDVATGTDLTRYMLANFGLYLRVSGLFHLIVGMIHLFGFRLPETHRFFYVAPSFTEFWRRINIYWKDFMTKVFYFPAYFRLKKYGERTALVVSTLIVFAATWVLHSYQWFWLLGTWLISWTDTLFWGILAVLLTINALRESSQGRKRNTKSTQWSFAERSRIILQTVMVFSVICLLWTMWTMPTMEEFGQLVLTPTWSARDVLVVLGVLATVALAAWYVQRREEAQAKSRDVTTMREILPGFAFLGVIWFAGEPVMRQLYSAEVNAFVRSTRILELSALERSQLQRGYYERIVDLNRFNGGLWDIYSRRPKEWLRLDQTDATETVNDPRLFRLRANHRTDLNGTVITTNSFGMRDKEYPVAKPPNTTRMALLGASYVMGIGVNDGESFDQFLETRLAEDTTGHGSRRVEILNFAVSAYLLQHQLALMESGELQKFGTDVVVIVGHLTDANRGPTYIYRLLASGQDVRYDTVRSIMRTAGWDNPPNEPEARRVLRDYEADLSRVTFARMGEVCRVNGWRCVYAYIPMPFEQLDPSKEVELLEFARAGGLEVVDMNDVYDVHDERSLIITEWDYHPNVKGHRIIANRLYDELHARPGLFTHQAPAARDSSAAAPASTRASSERPRQP
jgi:D-alanyl-lipoteichoic acid acyltransferase DltB (MBOAT superfamily)